VTPDATFSHIKESLAQLGIKVTIQKMPIGQKRSLMTKKQVDMAVYDWRPWTPDAGYFIYWNWLPESFWNGWSYVNAEAQTLGDEGHHHGNRLARAPCQIAAVSRNRQWRRRINSTVL
jgi:ABC-type transport system substrate-binding protein